MVSQGYHFKIELEGTFYQFVLPDPRSLVTSDLSPFTNRTTTGQLTLTDFHHQGAVEQRSFSTGMGQAELVEPTRYLDSTNLDTRTTGVVSLFTRTDEIVESLPTTNITITADDTYVYIGGTGGVFAWDGTTMTDISAGLPNTNVLGVFHNGVTLFAGLSGDTLQKFTGSVGVPSWADVNANVINQNAPINAQAFVVHDGYFWHAQAGSNLLHYWSAEDGEDAEGEINEAATGSHPHPRETADGDLGAVQIGPNGREVKRLESFDGLLYAFRDDGVWSVRLEQGDDGTLNYAGKRVFAFEPDPNNGNATCVWNGALWFTAERRIYRYTGATQTDFTNPPYSDTSATWPPVRDTPCKALFGIRGSMYALIQNRLFAFDGIGWHPLCEDIRGDDDRKAYLYYWQANDQLFVATESDNPIGPSLFKWGIGDEYSRPPYAEDGRLLTSWFDGGFLDVPKAWLNVAILAQIESASAVSSATIDLYAQNREFNNVETEYFLGSIDRSDGVGRVLRRFEFPYGLQGKALRFRFDLNRDPSDVTKTPLLLGYYVEYVLRPKTFWGQSLNLRLVDDIQTDDGRIINLPHDKVGLLIQMRDSIIPLRYEDFLGNRRWVYVSAVRFQPVDVKQVPHQDIEMNAVISLVEVDQTYVEDIPELVTLRVSGGWEVAHGYRLDGILEVYGE